MKRILQLFSVGASRPYVPVGAGLIISWSGVLSSFIREPVDLKLVCLYCLPATDASENNVNSVLLETHDTLFCCWKLQRHLV